MDQTMKECLQWILLVSMSPIAFLLLILMALLKLLQFLYKVSLLFIIFVINTPFAVMYNVSIVMFMFNLASFINSSWNYSYPRASPDIVSDFLKVVVGDLLVVLSTGVITFYTAPKLVFYISITLGVTAILLKWLHTNGLSKIAFSCLCEGYGLNPIMFLFSFIGLFDIGCHPIAKCSFLAHTAFLFVKDGTNPEEGNLEQGIMRFNGAMINAERPFVDFLKWNAFERGLFQLNPRIDFIQRKSGKFILKSFMVLKLLHKVTLCEYPMEKLELPEDYSKANELYNFFVDISAEDGFVTDMVRGHYEHSLTLLEIVVGVNESIGYNIIKPIDAVFMVAL